MKLRLIIALLLFAVPIGSLGAEELPFYRKETDDWWTVFGGANAETGQATCYGSAHKKDGSFVQIHRSLVDREVWAMVHDTAWEIQGPERGLLRWNFFNGLKNGLIGGADFDYVLKDKNTILILQIAPENFSQALWNARYFTLVMPGNVPNMSVSFGSKGASMLSAIAECVKENESNYKNFKPSLDKVPDSVKERL
ncbi:hypothetical protein ACVINW_001448 [Bradyrhizobium sp. USDA 4461]